MKLYALLAVLLASVSLSAAGPEIFIEAGHNNLRDALKVNPIGTKYVLHAGVHSSETPLQPNEGDLIQGLPGSVILVPEADCLQILKNGVKVHGVEIGPCGGRGVLVQGVSDTSITDSYIHPEFKSPYCCDAGDGIFVQRASGLLIQGNVIAYGEANIEIGASSAVTVLGNFFLNPLNTGQNARGQQVQSWGGNNGVSVIDNYAICSKDEKYKFPCNQEDAINFGGGTNYVASGNWVQGGWSGSGCGIIADDAANNCIFTNNTLYMTGQCGIGIADGTSIQVRNNRILNSFVKGGGNTAIYVWKQYDGPCGPVAVTDNIAYQVKPDGTTMSAWWDGGGCDPVTLTGNIWDQAAYNLLNPIESKFPPPSQVPPLPASCTVKSPFSANTRVAWC